MKALAVTALFMLASAGARADQDVSANALLSSCTMTVKIADESYRNTITNDDLQTSMECLNYLAGFRDGLQVLKDGFKANSPVCIPTEATNGQLARVLVVFMREHPEQLHEYRAFVATWAFTKAFPCADFKVPTNTKKGTEKF